MIEANPVSTLLQLAGGHCVPRCLHVVANLGVADALDETPRTAAELATKVGAHPDALGRVLRLLCTVCSSVTAIRLVTPRHRGSCAPTTRSPCGLSRE